MCTQECSCRYSKISYKKKYTTTFSGRILKIQLWNSSHFCTKKCMFSLYQIDMNMFKRLFNNSHRDMENMTTLNKLAKSKHMFMYIYT